MTDSFCVIALAKVGSLDLLTAVANVVLLPETVIEEILSGTPSDPARQAIEAGWGQNASSVPIPASVSALNLDLGETAVLALALAHGNCTVVLDDGKARREAKRLGIPVIGTLGIVLRAKQEGHLPAAKPILLALRGVGLYMDDTLLQAILTNVGESWP